MSSDKSLNRFQDCLTVLTTIAGNELLTEQLKSSQELSSCISSFLDLSKRLFREAKTLVPDELWKTHFDLIFGQEATNSSSIFGALKETITIPGVSEFLVKCPEWETTISTTVSLVMSILRKKSNASLMDNDLWIQLFDFIQDLRVTGTMVDACNALNPKVERMESSLESLTLNSSRSVDESTHQLNTLASDEVVDNTSDGFCSSLSALETRVENLENRTLQEKMDPLAEGFTECKASYDARFETINKELESLKTRIDSLSISVTKKLEELPTVSAENVRLPPSGCRKCGEDGHVGRDCGMKYDDGGTRILPGEVMVTKYCPN